MRKANRITDSEWEVMEVVWEKNCGLKASEIIDILKTKTSWSGKTIRTLIDRLVDKKVLGVKKENIKENTSINVYYAVLSNEECVKEVTDTFVQKIYKGSLGLLVTNFVKSNSLSQNDIKILKDLLKDNNETIKKAD